jgi:hypothetical protein
LDFIFKWASLKICDNNVQAFAKLTDYLEGLFIMLGARGYQVQDFEASLLMPTFVEKAGQGKDRFRLKMKDLLELFSAIYPHAKMGHWLFKGVDLSKNNRTKVAALTEIARLVSLDGVSICGKTGMKNIGAQVGSSDKDVREAALVVVSAAYFALDQNADGLLERLHPDSLKTKDLILQRIKNAKPPPGTAAAKQLPVEAAVEEVAVAVAVPTAKSHHAKTPVPKSHVATTGAALAITSVPTTVAPAGSRTGAFENPFDTGFDELMEVRDGAENTAVRTPPLKDQHQPAVSVFAAPHVSPTHLGSPSGAGSESGRSGNAYQGVDGLLSGYLKQLDALCMLDPALCIRSNGTYTRGKDALKIFLSMSQGDSADSTDQPRLVKTANEVLSKLVAVLRYSRCRSTSNSGAAKENGAQQPNSEGTINIQLMSLCLSTLMSVFRVPNLAHQLTEAAAKGFFEEVVHTLCDSALISCANQAALVNALNKLSSKAAYALRRPVSLCALLALLQNCVQSHLNNVPQYSEAEVGVFGTLLLRTMRKEANEAQPFLDSPETITQVKSCILF